MSESEDTKTRFFGTYFERDSVLQLARIADWFSWGVLAIYAAQTLLSLTVFVLQISRKLIFPAGPTDFVQQLLWIFQPITPGLLYFVSLRAVGRFLLIFMDIEDNTRRAARK